MLTRLKQDALALIILVSALAFLPQSAWTQDTLYVCDGVVRDEPCQAGAKTRFIDLDQEPEQPPPPKPTSAPVLQPTALPELELRELNMTERPKPVLNWQLTKSDKFISRFAGKLTAAGEVDLIVSANLLNLSGQEKLKTLKTMSFRLPAEGATKDFDFNVATPTSPVRWWTLEAINKGRWSGSRNLQGCCPKATDPAECLGDGRVSCGRQISAKCRCK